MATEYRFSVETSVCFSIVADSDEAAQAAAKEVVEYWENGVELRGVGGHDPVLYSDPSNGHLPECVDVVDDVEADEEAASS